MTEKKLPRLIAGSAARCAARDVMVEIISGWAAEGRPDTYGRLSALMKESGYSVPPRGTLMGALLKEACLVEAGRGVPVMLTAIMVNGHSKRPSGQFEVFAKEAPFRRGDQPNWTWEAERDRVFAHYRQ